MKPCRLIAVALLFFVLPNADAVQRHHRHRKHTYAKHSLHPLYQATKAPAASSGPTVWVNTNTGVYHYPGSRWYENTQQGKLIPESQAIAQGDRAAENGQ